MMTEPFSIRVGSRVYLKGNFLGKGAQANVIIGKDVESDEFVALRSISRSNLSAEKLNKLEREINIMKVVDHPNIIAMKQVDLDIIFSGERSVLMVLELAPNGELFEFLMTTGFFPEELSRAYYLQIISALKYCHEMNIFHRDIKPENILLDRNFQIKIADFGLSTMQDSNDSMLQTFCGTKEYMAPEVLAKQSYQGASADIWSSGVVLFTMLCGNPPFIVASRGDWWYNAVCLYRHDRFWSAHFRSAPHMVNNHMAQNLINHIFLEKSNERYKIDDILADSWINRPQVLTKVEIRDIMLSRQSIIQERKASEFSNIAKKSRRSEGKDDSFDPFHESHVFRSLNNQAISNSEALRYIDSPSTSFLLHLDPKQLHQLLLEASLRIDKGAIVNPERDFSVTVTLDYSRESFDLDGEIIEYPVQKMSISVSIQKVQESDDDKEIYLINFERLTGNLNYYHDIIRLLRESLTSQDSADFYILQKCVHRPALDDNASAVEEPLLSDIVEMI